MHFDPKRRLSVHIVWPGEELMRAFLIVIAVIFAAFVLMISAGWYWWHVHGESVVTSGRAALTDGRRRGAGVDEAACLAEVLQRTRADQDGGMSEVIARSIWLDGCLGTSRPAASLCEGVPPPHEIINMSHWVLAACTRQDLANPGCQSLLQEVAKYCASPGRAAKLARR
jgi:hypothetical protein